MFTEPAAGDSGGYLLQFGKLRGHLQATPL